MKLIKKRLKMIWTAYSIPNPKLSNWSRIWPRQTWETYKGNNQLLTSAKVNPNERNKTGSKERVPENLWEALQRDYLLQEQKRVPLEAELYADGWLIHKKEHKCLYWIGLFTIILIAEKWLQWELHVVIFPCKGRVH